MMDKQYKIQVRNNLMEQDAPSSFACAEKREAVKKINNHKSLFFYKTTSLFSWQSYLGAVYIRTRGEGGSSLFTNSTRYFIPVKIENSTCDIFLLLSALSSCVVCVFIPKYKSAAAAYVFVILRNVTCESHAPYNIYTTWEERSETKMARSANPLK